MLFVYIRTLLLYVLLIGMLRLMGKRQLGEMEPSEFVVTMMAANLTTTPIEDPDFPLLLGVTAVLTILGAELALSTWTLCSIRARRLFCGKPVILIENGRLLQENLRRTRISLDELMGQLRQKEILELESVQYAILETDGGLSVFPRPEERPASARDAGIPCGRRCLPVTVIEDGRLLKENLRKAGKDETWLEGILRDRNGCLGETLFLTVDEQDRIRYLRKEKRR